MDSLVPYLKVAEPFGSRIPLHRHRRDPCGRRPDSKLGKERLDRLPRSFHIQFDPAVVKVAHSADQLSLCGHSRRKRPVPDPLHSTAYENVRTNRRCRPGFSHMSRAGLPNTLEYSHTS